MTIMKKKILYLCHRIPYPPNKGDKIRSFHQIKYLSKFYDLDLITLADDPNDLQYEGRLAEYCNRVKIFPLNKIMAKMRGFLGLLSGNSISQYYFYLKEMQRVYNEWMTDSHYHAVYCFSSSMAEYILQSRKNDNKINSSIRYIIDFCDLDSDKWKQYSQNSSIPIKYIYHLEATKLLEYEKKINKFFDKTIFISNNEAELFKKYYPEAENISIIPNGVDHLYFSPEKTNNFKSYTAPTLMFSGAMDYYANVDGIKWFVNEIFPKIKLHTPDIKFFIVGSNPSPVIKKLEKDPCITVTGYVDDIRKYYQIADICVIPLRIARGVQNKVLESMAVQKAVVTTSQAIQGINPDPDKEIVIANTPYEFAEQVIKLLENKGRAKELGCRARKFIQKQHNWDTNLFDLSLFIK